MNDIANLISRIRNNLQDDTINPIDNRYKIECNENDGSKTAYFFNSPIYNTKINKVISRKFELRDDEIYLMGSNAEIIIKDSVCLKNSVGSCKFQLKNKADWMSNERLSCGNDYILPTANGIVYKAFVNQGECITAMIETNAGFPETRSNDKYFAIMNAHFSPFATVSCIGLEDISGEIVSPANISFQKINDNKYEFTVYSYDDIKGHLLFEINLYEPKLFQDTTVESKNPNVNNVFGTMAFLGNTEHFGEQWLYTKLDLSKTPELTSKHINKAILHIPKMDSNNGELLAFNTVSRFCSFGSNWINKMESSDLIKTVKISDDYYSFDITYMLQNYIKHFITSNGIVIRPKNKQNGFSLLPTADSCYKHQILEINY